ncbi:MAG: efflux RND transporter periplasmic adaptor subunit [Mizugakiibacter sp.]|uniref:efflux RND transporter periplasmic adaptor subunit n=1 Tax=Mizugakiibacter sp. TaxID=1972610 RepID=UPI0031C525DE|nr:efflux RND transporter periplasmic adaptor subunit [Xanthomonadaceae bacterium]
MKRLPLQGRTLALLAVLVPMLLLFVYVALRSGPLAPVRVTVATVAERPVTPALYGIGTVEARYTYRIGPTFAGRVSRVDVQVGDRVAAGQVLGEMDPVDLDERIRAQDAALRRADAQQREAAARQRYAQSQMRRYEQLLASHVVSEETVASKRQEQQVADAALAAAGEELVRIRADREALAAQRGNLRLVAPVAGLVAARDADPGTTVVAGQAVLEVIDPGSVWINVRFDQISAQGLAAGLPARVVLRSRAGQALAGRVLRVEPMADAVTEETLAKVVFDALPEPLPPLGELAEVTVAMPTLAAAPVVPNSVIRHVDGRLGVWRVEDGDPQFAAVELGAADLDGNVQVRRGLEVGDRVVAYSEKAVTARTRIHVVDRIPGAAR